MTWELILGICAAVYVYYFNIFVVRVSYTVDDRTVWSKWLFYKIFWP